MKRSEARRTTILVLGMILAGHALLWWLHPYDFLDDLDSQHYARIAAELATGEFTLEAHPFHDRFGVTVPTAAIYGLFGVGSRATTLWSVLASLSTIVVVFLTTRRISSSSAALLAAFLLATNPVQVQYAAHLLPDVIVGLFMVGGVALLLAAREATATGATGRPWLHGGLCALVLVGGLMTKKTILWVFLFYAGVMAWDLVRGRNARLWSTIVVTGAVLLGLFGLSYYLTTGNPLRVLTSIETTHNVSSLASFFGSGEAEYLERLGLEPFEFLVREFSFGYLLVLAMPALVHLVRPRHAPLPGVRFWGAYTVVVLVCFWFGTTSLRSYNPLPVTPRHMMTLLAPLSILGGVVLGGLVSRDEPEQRKRFAMSGAAAAIVAAAAAMHFSMPARVVIYGVLGLTIVLLAWAARPLFHGRLGGVARVAILAIVPLFVLFREEAEGGVKRSNSLRVMQLDFVGRHVAPLPGSAIVFTDEHSAFVLPLLLDRVGASRVQVVDWGDATAVRSHAGKPAYVFIDQTTLSMMSAWFGREVPSFARMLPRGWRRLAVTETLWLGESPEHSRPLFPVARIALVGIDDPIELVGPDEQP